MNQPLSIIELPEDEEDDDCLDIVSTLENYYLNISKLKKHNYTLSKEAFKVFKKKHDLIDKTIEANQHNPSLCTILSKEKGRIGRFALNLQPFNYAGTDNFSPIIGAEIMQFAVEISDYYLNEILEFHSEIKAERGNLTDRLKGLKKFIEDNNNEVEIRKVCRKYTKKKDIVLGWFNQLKDAGQGQLILDDKEKCVGFRLFHKPSDNSDISDNQAQTLTQKEIQDNSTSDKPSDNTSDNSDNQTSEARDIEPPIATNSQSVRTVRDTVRGSVRTEKSPEPSRSNTSDDSVRTVRTVRGKNKNNSPDDGSTQFKVGDTVIYCGNIPRLKKDYVGIFTIYMIGKKQIKVSKEDGTELKAWIDAKEFRIASLKNSKQ